MARRHVRSKEYGREVENAAKRKLSVLWPDIKRTGSTAYSKDAADLVQDGDSVVPIVVTCDKGQPLLVTLSADDFVSIARVGVRDRGVAVQCKGRQQTWIGGVMRGLKAALKAKA